MDIAVQQHPAPLSDFIRQHRDAILEEWAHRVRRIAVAHDLSRPRLIDHVPDLLDRVAEVIRGDHEGGPATLDGLARLHALDRIDRGFDLKEVVSEYALLRSCVVDLYCQRSETMRGVEVRRFNDAIDEAIRASAQYYAEQRIRVLSALDRLTTASPAGLSLHELLDRLLGVFIESSEVVDTTSILLLEEDGFLRVRASIGLSDEVKHNWRVPFGEGFAGTIAATRRPLTLRNPSDDPLPINPFLKSAGMRALYGVPLMFKDELLGVAHMGSRSAYEFSEEDRALFRVLTTRAAVFIHENMLRTEAERRAAELEATIDAIPGEVLISDTAGRLRANAAALSMFGASSADELKNGNDARAARMNIRDADDERAIAEQDLPFARALRGEALRSDLRLHHLGRDEDVTIRAVAAPIRLHGELAGGVCVCVDISDRRALEKEREELLAKIDEERERLVATLRQVPAGVVIADAATEKIVLSNEAAAAIWRGALAADTLPGYRSGRIFWADDRPMAPKDYPLKRALRGELVHEEVRIHRLDGTWGTVLSNGGPVRSRDGQIVAAVVAFVDITERKTAEEQFRALADNIPQLAWIADASGKIYWYNRQWLDYAGSTRDQIQGSGWIDFVHPDHVERVVQNIRQHLASGQPWEDTFPLRGTDGRYRWFLSRATAIRDEAGAVIRWYGTNTDVTEHRKLQEAREQFIAILGHDLRNPLNAITMNVGILDNKDLEASVKRTVERIASSALRMRMMIDDLLDFTRGRLGGGIPIEPRPTDFSAVAATVLEEIATAHAGTRIGLDVKGDACGTWDPARLAQIVQNLVTNAIQHGDREAGVSVAIDGRASDEVTLTVTNRGPIIPPDLIPHLFEPFRRLAKSRPAARSSLGLGLFIVSEIVRAHQGKVAVRSDGETVFEVRLPRAVEWNARKSA